jgi:predicted helicase
MYARFYRWAMDRISDDGIIAFITNRSFIDSRTFDGFRKSIMQDFDYAYIVDTKSDVRQNPKIAGTTHNVFGIQTGVAIMFLVKNRQTGIQESILPPVGVNGIESKGQFGLRNAKGSSTSAPKSKTSDTDRTYLGSVDVLNSFPACRIGYYTMEDNWRKEDKLLWLTQHQLKDIPFTHVTPDKDNNWINLAENDWDEFIPVADKQVKNNKSKEAIFQLYSLGVVTARDEWVYDDNYDALSTKINKLIDVYNDDVKALVRVKERSLVTKSIDYSIKWTRAVINDLLKGKTYKFDKKQIKASLYRPYIKKFLYYAHELNEMQYQLPSMFNGSNILICINQFSNKPFNVLASNIIPDYHLNGDANCLSLYRYDSDGKRQDNITDWALGEFRTHYKQDSISKEDIFHYVYGVLHDPAYRKKYELNLKRSFPRLPYYEDFAKWANWGKALMELHLNFETVQPYPLKIENGELEMENESVAPAQAGVHAVLKNKNTRLPSQSLDSVLRGNDEKYVVPPSGGSIPNNIAAQDKQNRINAVLHTPKAKLKAVDTCVPPVSSTGEAPVATIPKAKLKADKEKGCIILDTQTTLSGIPSEAWSYKLGNRSALEWILDQYKEKKPKDPTIAKLFNTYRFADYKDKVIDLLMRVTTVSVETMKIVREMEKVSKVK